MNLFSKKTAHSGMGLSPPGIVMPIDRFIHVCSRILLGSILFLPFTVGAEILSSYPTLELPKKYQHFTHVSDIVDGRTIPLKKKERVLMNAATTRNWSILERQDGIIVLHLTHKKISANLVLLYDNRKISIFSDSYNYDRKGKRAGDLVPYRWLGYLEHDIRRGLGKILLEKKE